MIDFKIAKANADGFKAFLLMRAGLQEDSGALKKVPEEVLYQSVLPLILPYSNGWRDNLLSHFRRRRQV